jgi:parallel beta-helix repeat protein
VTHDLRGFALIGVAGSRAGIETTGNSGAISVRDGSVSGWGQGGVMFPYSRNCCVEDVTAHNNGGAGVYAGEDAVVVRCVGRENASVGVGGMSGSTISGCVGAYNGGAGILAGPGSSVSECAARNNQGAGFECGGTATLSACTSTYNSNGYVAGYGTNYSGCTAAYNVNDGFWVNASSMATACSAYDNGRDGFHVWHGTVNGCRADSNGRDGIRLDTGYSTASENTCRENGTSETGAGIRAVGTACRIEANQVITNDYGVVAAADCVIVRNTARGNSSGNYSLAAGSDYGQILTNPGANFSASNPWANFAY